MDSENDFLDIPFRGIVEQSLAGVYVIQDEIFRYVNSTFAAIAGYTPQEVIGLHLSAIVPKEAVDEVVHNYYRRIRGEAESIRFITQGVHKNGSIVHLEVHGSRLLYQGRLAVVGVGIDVTERVQREEELRKSHERLRELAAYINTVREEQRSRIARELHDVVGGMLTSMKLDIQRIARRVQDKELLQMTEDLLGLAQETIVQVREISECLRPGLLDHFGLVTALRVALKEFAGRTGIVVTMSPDELELHLSQSQATGVYRICQEALTNISRHAQASEVTISLEKSEKWLTVEVRDNGRGFQVLTPTGKSIGLVSMAERAHELGGSLEICSEQGNGTRLLLRVPLENAA